MKYPPEFAKISKRLRERAGCCSDCGRKSRLIVHHIDKNPQNSNLRNLVVLCQECHSVYHWKETKPPNPTDEFNYAIKYLKNKILNKISSVLRHREELRTSVPVKKLRDVQKGGASVFGDRFDIINGRGQIIAKVYPPNYEEELPIQNLSLPENFAENFMEMYRMVEQTNSKVEERLT